MQFTVTSAAAVLAFIYATPALAVAETTVCDGNTAPDWGDCDMLANIYDDPDHQTYYQGGPNECFGPALTNVEPNSLNCIILVCIDADRPQGALGDAIYSDYVILKATCDGDTPTVSGGTTTDTNYGLNITAALNPNYNPPSKKEKKREAVSEQSRNHARSWSELERRDGGICTDGTGTFEIEDTFKNTAKPGDMIAVTGRLPNGSSYMISEADSQSIGITTSVSVEAGFFDLFSATASISVNADYSVTTTTGVTVVVDCNAGQEGIIYLTPVFTEYYGHCTSNNNAPITVDVPEDTQNNYIVQCLGDPS